MAEGQAEDFGVKGASPIDVGHGQHEMIEASDVHRDLAIQQGEFLPRFGRDTKTGPVR